MMLKILTGIMVVVFFLTQFRLWVGEGSVHHVQMLQRDIAAQEKVNKSLAEKNQQLRLEVDALKNSQDAIEYEARSELGLVKPGETLYKITND